MTASYTEFDIENNLQFLIEIVISRVHKIFAPIGFCSPQALPMWHIRFQTDASTVGKLQPLYFIAASGKICETTKDNIYNLFYKDTL